MIISSLLVRNVVPRKGTPWPTIRSTRMIRA